MNQSYYNGKRQNRVQVEEMTNTLYKQRLPLLCGLPDDLTQEQQQKIWQNFPFTSLFIRVGQWTIQQDFKLLYLYDKYFETKLKWNTIQVKFGTTERSKSAIKNRLTLILQKLRYKFQKYRGKKDIKIIREYLQDLRYKGYNITQQIAQGNYSSYQPSNRQQASYTFNYKSSQNNLQKQERIKKAKRLNKKSKLQQKQKQKYNYNYNYIDNMYQSDIDEQILEMQNRKYNIINQQHSIFDRMMQGIQALQGLIEMAQHLTSSRQIM